MKEDWFDECVEKLEKLEKEGKVGTEEFMELENCVDGYHNEYSIIIELTPEGNVKAKKVCQKCGADFEAWRYKKDIDTIEVKSNGVAIESFLLNKEE